MSIGITGMGSVGGPWAGDDAVGAAQPKDTPTRPATPMGLDELRGLLGERGLRHFDRTALLLCAAAQGALEQSRLLSSYTPDEVAVVTGETHGSTQAISDFDRGALREGPRFVNPQHFANTVIHAAGARLALRFGVTGSLMAFSSGSTSALDALDHACAMLESGRASAALVGAALGADPALDEGYRRAGWLAPSGTPVPFGRRSPGAKLGEGAAVFALERADRARARGAVIHAIVASTETSLGRRAALDVALATVLARALQRAGIAARHVGVVISDACGSPTLDLVEARGIEHVFGPRGVPVTAFKGATGDCIEASPALAIAGAVRSLATQSVPPIHGLRQDETVHAGLDTVTSTTRRVELRHILIAAKDRAGYVGGAVLSHPCADSTAHG